MTKIEIELPEATAKAARDAGLLTSWMITVVPPTLPLPCIPCHPSRPRNHA